MQDGRIPKNHGDDPGFQEILEAEYSPEEIERARREIRRKGALSPTARDLHTMCTLMKTEAHK